MGKVADKTVGAIDKSFDLFGRAHDELERSLESGGKKLRKSMVPDIPKPPKPPAASPVAPGGAPDITTATANTARAEQDASDALRRKRGRASTVLTSNEGVGATPLGRKTLVGS